jgi:HEPN domain-containing protein
MAPSTLAIMLEAAGAVAGMPLDDDVRNAGVRLARHYQPTRYPDALPGGTPRERYTADDAEVAIADAEAIVAAVDEAMHELRVAAGEEGSDDHSF